MWMGENGAVLKGLDGDVFLKPVAQPRWFSIVQLTFLPVASNSKTAIRLHDFHDVLRMIGANDKANQLARNRLLFRQVIHGKGNGAP